MRGRKFSLTKDEFVILVFLLKFAKFTWRRNVTLDFGNPQVGRGQASRVERRGRAVRDPAGPRKHYSISHSLASSILQPGPNNAQQYFPSITKQLQTLTNPQTSTIHLPISIKLPLFQFLHFSHFHLDKLQALLFFKLFFCISLSSINFSV